LNVAVRIVNPPQRSVIDTKLHSVHERQTVAISSTARREIQQVNFTSSNGRFMLYITDFGARSAQISLNSTDTGLFVNALKVTKHLFLNSS
jgi:hypothetical protein